MEQEQQQGGLEVAASLCRCKVEAKGQGQQQMEQEQEQEGLEVAVSLCRCEVEAIRCGIFKALALMYHNQGVLQA